MTGVAMTDCIRVELMSILMYAKSGEKDANMNKAMRYFIENVHNYIFNIDDNVANGKKSPDFIMMSTNFHNVWVNAGRPTGDSALKKIGILEHRIPHSVILQRLSEQCHTEDDVVKCIRENYKIVCVTHEEDELLRSAGLNSCMPSDGRDRYDVVGIEVMPNAVAYKNLKKI
jgi:hypothetical protein